MVGWFWVGVYGRAAAALRGRFSRYHAPPGHDWPLPRHLATPRQVRLHITLAINIPMIVFLLNRRADGALRARELAVSRRDSKSMRCCLTVRGTTGYYKE